MTWLANNGGTLAVSLLLIAGVALIVRGIVRDKKKGRSACGNACSSCPMCGSCHRKDQTGAGA